MADDNNDNNASSNPKNADRSSMEIKDLLRKLHPDRGNHKDRIRRLNRFRNYIMPTSVTTSTGASVTITPEFYDDDIPLLFLGAETPAIYLDEEYDDLPLGLYYGLLLACGTQNPDSKFLKRSARHAMNILKWMLLDWKEGGNSGNVNSPSNEKDQQQLNMFAKSFLSLPVSYYRHMKFHLHIVGDDRGGAKEDACQIVCLILTNHLSDDGTNETPSPVLLEEILVGSPQAQQMFDIWSATSNYLTQNMQDKIKKNSLQRQAEIALQQRQDAILQKNTGGERNADDLDLLVDESEHSGGGRHHHNEEGEHEDNDDEESEETEESYGEGDELDVMAAIRKRQKTIKKELQRAQRTGEIGKSRVNAVRWEDSQCAREQAMRERKAAKSLEQQKHKIRESQDAVQELEKREQDKVKQISKDPLGIYGGDVDDNDHKDRHNEESDHHHDDDGNPQHNVRKMEQSQAEQMELALHDIQEDIQRYESAQQDELVKRAIYQKESLEQLADQLGGLEAMEQQINSQQQLQQTQTNTTSGNKALARSILPTSSKFHPLLFLSLMHRKTNYKDLVASMERLSGKTENQAEQLQNLVRDNFPLFVRCAEGFEEFRTTSEAEVGLGVSERIEKLEAIAESAAFQAKKSFKPLLDNTSEVRKVQSALAVLQRVAPILAVPALMRQHIENRRYSQALKTYRRCLVIDDTCNISLLNHVKRQAETCVRDARRDLERRLTQDKAPLDDLLNGIRDLGELLELDVPALEISGEIPEEESPEDKGIYEVEETVVNVRDHPPALACLLLQAAHFSAAAKELIQNAEDTALRIYSGESLSSVQTTERKEMKDDENENDKNNNSSPTFKGNQGGASGNQWKYDVLDGRVLSTIKAVDIARLWLERLVRIGKAAREEEKRRAVKIGHRSRSSAKGSQLSAFEVFVVNISPSLTKLVEHAAFCSLGSNTRTGAKYVEMTFAGNVDEKLRTLLRSPLPPSQSTKVGKELAALVDFLTECSDGVDDLRPETALLHMSPLEASKSLGDSALITIEKRRCIYAFDVCSRACSNRASGSGKFDADALLNCLQNLSEQLTRPEECSNEVEKGCELVIRRCCEGLASFVRDRGDDARLSAVAECADCATERIDEIVREASFLTNKSDSVKDAVMEDILGLESAMFDEYLESIHLQVENSVRVGWLDRDAADEAVGDGDSSQPPCFPSYLSASLLAIVRCRAQVEQTLGNRVRQPEDLTYQHLSMATVADGVVEGICNEVMKRKLKLKVRMADRLANELEFLNNTLKKFLSDDILSLLDSTLHMVSSKAGRGRGDGPDGLAALEELERLGRVYVLCLGD